MSNNKEQVQNEAGSESDTDEKRPDQFLCNTPGFMSAAVRRQVLHEMFKMLPQKTQNRVRALKNLQLEQMKIETEFYEEIYNLEKKYLQRYQPLFDKRKEIICGDVEPSNEEANWKSDNEEEMTEKMKEISLKVQKSIKPKYTDDVKGIPDFWLTIFRSTELLSEMVQEHDEPVFKKLSDIKIVYVDSPMSYILEFHFDKNEYFSNQVLTKQYFLKSTIDKDYPWSFEGPEIFKCTGCTINWEKGMNLTIKTIRKKQKHKERGAVRTITKQVPNDSFFNFFNPPEVNEDSKEDEETQQILATDYEIGHFLRSRIIPRAVLYYTGDIVDDDDDDDEYDEEEEEEDEEEDDEFEPEEGGDANNTGGQQQHNKHLNKKKSTPNDCPNQ